MSLNIILFAGVMLSVAFHFIGVYAGAKKIVWIAIALMWAGSIDMAMSEVKPAAYDEVKKMQGQFVETDKLIKDSGETMSLYEFLLIKKSFIINTKPTTH